MPSKFSSAFVVTLLLSHTVLAPLTAIAQEQDASPQQVQEKTNSSLNESVSTSSPEASENVGQDSTTQANSQTQTENTEETDVSTNANKVLEEAQSTQAVSTNEEAFTVNRGVITAYDVTKGGTDVVIPSTVNGQTVTGIDNFVFSNKGLTSVSLPDTLLTIGRYSFDGNNSLTSISLPQSLQRIDDGAFRNCGLTGSLIIPDTVNYLGSQAFLNNQLVDVVIGKGIERIYSETFAGNPITNLNLGQITQIGPSAFMNTSLDQLVIPSTVTYIADQAFMRAKINNLELSERLTYIGRNAFSQCQFQNLVLPDSVKTVEQYAFSGGQIRTLKIGKGLKKVDKGVFGGNQIETADLGTIETISGEGAFRGNKIKTLTLPDTLKTISGSSVFSNNEIESIIWGSGLTDTGRYTFSSNHLKNITVPIKTVGDFAFYDNPLEDVSLADNVETVGRSAFAAKDRNNRTLKRLDLGNGVKSIGDQAFAFGLLDKVNLPASLTSIGSSPFCYNNLTYIEPGATNPKSNYGLQKLEDKEIVNNSQETQLKINLTEIYPGIDPNKVEITRVKYGVSTSDTPFKYDKTTGVLSLSSGGSVGSTIYYNYKVDNNTVLSVEQYWGYINQWTVTWKSWDGSVFQEDILKGPYGSNLQATYPTNSPVRLGYTFSHWSRDKFTGGYNPLRIESDTSFTAYYTQNKYLVNYDYNYPDASSKIETSSFTWEQTNLNNRSASFAGYDFVGWEYNGQLVTSTDTIAKLLNNVDPGDGATITLTAKWEKKKVYMSVPTTVDFGSHILSIGEKTYGATVSGNPLKVHDERGDTYSWKVTAKLTSELINKNGVQILNALHYQTGNHDKIFSSSSAIDIASGKGTKDISASWSDSEGLLLKVDSSKYKTGEYSSTIEWTLNDTP